MARRGLGPDPEAPWAALGLGLRGGLRFSAPPPHIPLFWRGGPGGAEAPLRRPLGGGQGRVLGRRGAGARGSLGRGEGWGGEWGGRARPRGTGQPRRHGEPRSPADTFVPGGVPARRGRACLDPEMKETCGTCRRPADPGNWGRGRPGLEGGGKEGPAGARPLAAACSPDLQWTWSKARAERARIPRVQHKAAIGTPRPGRPSTALASRRGHAGTGLRITPVTSVTSHLFSEGVSACRRLPRKVGFCGVRPDIRRVDHVSGVSGPWLELESAWDAVGRAQALGWEGRVRAAGPRSQVPGPRSPVQAPGPRSPVPSPGPRSLVPSPQVPSPVPRSPVPIPWPRHQAQPRPNVHAPHPGL